MNPASSNRDASMLAVRIRAELADIALVKDLGHLCAFLEALEETE